MSNLSIVIEKPQLPNLLTEQIDYSKYTFLFISEPDACDDCRAFHHMELTLEDIEFLFGEYLERNEYVWHPNVHPHCRCVLILYRVIEEMILETVAIIEMATRTFHAHAFKGGEEVNKQKWDSNLNLN